MIRKDFNPFAQIVSAENFTSAETIKQNSTI